MKPKSISSVQRLLVQKRLKGFYVTNPTCIRYLTGFNVSYGRMIISSKKAQLFLDGRYIEMALAKRLSGVQVLPLRELKGALSQEKSLAFDADTVTVSQLKAWKTAFKSTKFVQTSGLVEEVRRSKTPEELASIIKACAITRTILKKIPSMLKPGITEADLAWHIETESRKRGAEKMSFETIVAFAENTSSPHHHPTQKKLKRGDLVQIDMGVVVDGYMSDYSRIFYTGKKTIEQAKAERALRESITETMKLVKVGASTKKLDETARKVLKKYGYDKEFSHSLGHGVGLEIHEMPTLSTRAKDVRLKKNEVITIEPGLYFPGKFGMRIEDTVIVR